MSSSDGELPPLLPGSSSHARRFSRTSKRSRDSDNSSDSAFFSSDDLAEASVDRYKKGARQKQYSKRSWYEPEDRTRLHTYQPHALVGDEIVERPNSITTSPNTSDHGIWQFAALGQHLLSRLSSND